MSNPARHPGASPAEREPVDARGWSTVFAGAFGLCLGLSIAKLGNPVILDSMVAPPSSFWEFVFNSWPMAWGYCLLALAALAAIPVLRRNRTPHTVVILLPAIWFGWQLVAATSSIDSRLTSPTVIHFGCCLVCFYLGWRALSHGASATWFWIPVLICSVWVLWSGFTQHFGGLESTRRLILEQGTSQNLPPEFLKRIESGRIFATFVYPNALAGAILLLLPPLSVVVWSVTRNLSNIPRGIVTGSLAYAGLACLWWSGSKSGWLIALILGSVALLRLTFRPKTRLIIVGALVVIGVCLFAVRYQGYFQKGATSVSARFDYWKVAWKVAESNPLVGTGPGTFSIPYRELKRPESEMTRLVHNDFLEQACDSGWIGLLAYAAFVASSLTLLYGKTLGNPLQFGAWVGVLGWGLQSFVEFGLYIPALAWTAFAILGWLWAAEPNGSTSLNRRPILPTP